MGLHTCNCNAYSSKHKNKVYTHANTRMGFTENVYAGYYDITYLRETKETDQLIHSIEQQTNTANTKLQSTS